MDPFVSLFTNLGLGTALVVVQVWFLRYLVTQTIPSILAQHREDLAQLRGDMDRRHGEVIEELKTLREDGCGRYCLPPMRPAEGK